MLLRAVRRRQRGQWLPLAVLTAAMGASYAPSLNAQESKSPIPPTHTVKRGDTLWDIAKLYLGDSYLWPEIYRLNTDIIEDPHWIYPGETLKLPGDQARVVAVTPPSAEPKAIAPTPAPSRPAAAPPARVEAAPAPASPQAPSRTVRPGEYAAAPWVDVPGGPRNSGFIIRSGQLPGVASADQSQMQLYDPVFFSPPTDSVPVHSLFLAYRLGPLIENFGQVVIPTGVIEVTRTRDPREAVTGRVVKMFDVVEEGQRLIPFDTSGALVQGRPSAVANGRSGKVRWIYNQPILPSLQRYLILDIAGRDGIATGDQVELYQPRERPVVEGALAIPEIAIARAQVLRVTPLGATAIIVDQDQPKIHEGTAARIAAKMP